MEKKKGITRVKPKKKESLKISPGENKKKGMNSQKRSRLCEEKGRTENKIQAGGNRVTT